jgi:hypothetical protein
LSTSAKRLSQHNRPIASCREDAEFDRYPGHNGHGATFCWLDPVAIDPQQTFTLIHAGRKKWSASVADHFGTTWPIAQTIR